MTDENDLKTRRLSRQLQIDEADVSSKPKGAMWLQQMLPRFAFVIQNRTPVEMQIVATHYGVGLPSGQVVLFTVGINTIVILPSWDHVHQLVDAAQGRIALVMEEQDVRMETEPVA